MSTPLSQQPSPATPVDEETLDVRDYLRPVWARKWLILAIVVIAAAGAYAIGARQRSAAARTTKEYVSSSEVIINVADPAQLLIPNATPTPPDGQQMSDLATLFTDQAITQAVYRQLGMPVGSAGSVTAGLLNSTTATTFGTSIIVVQATSPSAKLAAQLANAYVAQFLASRKRSEAAAATAQESALRAQLDSLVPDSTNAAARRALLLQISDLGAVVRNPSAGASRIYSASVPSAPVNGSSASRSPTLDAVIGGAVGLLLGVGLAFGVSLFDRRLRRVSSIEASYGRPVLAVLPHVAKPTQRVGGHTLVPPEFLESLRSLRINLRLLRGGSPPRTVVVTSALPGEGKSTVAGNLALVCAESGERVLLIDADLRRPNVAKLFGVDAEFGLTHVLRGEASAADAVVTVQQPETAQPSQNGASRAAPGADPRLRGVLDVLAHGDLQNDPVPLLASRAMVATLQAASRRYDVVIIDTAPVLAVADTVSILGAVDAVLLVARLGATTRDAAERLTETLARVPDANVVGVVANDARGRLVDGGYGGVYSVRRGGYGYGHRNGTAGASRGDQRAARAAQSHR